MILAGECGFRRVYRGQGGLFFLDRSKSVEHSCLGNVARCRQLSSKRLRNVETRISDFVPSKTRSDSIQQIKEVASQSGIHLKRHQSQILVEGIG